MAKLHNPTVGLLLTGLLLLQGVHGQEPVAVFSSVGGAATLPCHVDSYYTDTSFTEWLYNGNGGSTVSKVRDGQIIAHYTPRAERLSLHSNSSLHITDVTTEDAGRYSCRQYPHGGSQYEPDTEVYFSVLTSMTERETDRDETLYCQLHFYWGLNSVFYNRDIRLSWVDDGGTELQTTDCHRFTRASPCSIPLNVKLRDSNPTHTQRTWRCQLTVEGQVQTSVSHTVRVAVKPTRSPVVTRQPEPPQPPPTRPTASPTPTPPETPPQPPPTPPESTLTPTPSSEFGPVFPIALSCGLLPLVAICGAALLLLKKRTGAHGSRDGIRTQISTNKLSDVTYAEVTHHPQARSSPPNAADSVTYATINITNKT